MFSDVIHGDVKHSDKLHFFVKLSAVVVTAIMNWVTKCKKERKNMVNLDL